MEYASAAATVCVTLAGKVPLASSPTAQVDALDTVHVQLQAAVCAMPDLLA